MCLDKVAGTTPKASDGPIATASANGIPSPTLGTNATSPSATLPPQFTDVGSAGERSVVAGMGMVVAAAMGAVVGVL